MNPTHPTPDTPTTPRYEECDDPERLAAHRREFGLGSVEILNARGEILNARGEWKWRADGPCTALGYRFGLSIGLRYRLVHSSPSEPPNPCALEDVPHDDCLIGGEPDKTGLTKKEVLEAGMPPRTAVWWRWPEPRTEWIRWYQAPGRQLPTGERIGPIAHAYPSESNPGGMYVEYELPDRNTTGNPHRRDGDGWIEVLRESDPGPEPKGLTFPDDPTDADEASTTSGEKVCMFASTSTKGTAGLYLHDRDDDQAAVYLTPAELRSLRDRCDTVLTHLEGQS